jgi:hypothetical protein
LQCKCITTLKRWVYIDISLWLFFIELAPQGRVKLELHSSYAVSPTFSPPEEARLLIRAYSLAAASAKGTRTKLWKLYPVPIPKIYFLLIL